MIAFSTREFFLVYRNFALWQNGDEENMYRQIESILMQYGYEGIRLNVENIYFALRQEKEEGYAVVTLDETKGNQLSKEQFHHVSEQLRVFLQSRGCYHCRFLYLLVSEDDSSTRRLFQNFECFWRIIPSKGQLMVFEDVDEGFLGLRSPLENIFAGELRNRVGQGGLYQAGLEKRGDDFWDSLRKRNFPWCNVLIILLNVAIFLYMDFFKPITGEIIMEKGALGWQQVIGQGQWYRMFSSMFLHVDGEHLINNMLVLAYMGSCLELAIGSLRYGILYIGSGLLAGTTSMVYNMVQNDYAFSAGASGAIFGTVGAMLFLVLFRKGRKAQYSVRQIVWMAFLSLYGGLASQGIDNAAHFGGFVAGFLLAGLLTVNWKSGR